MVEVTGYVEHIVYRNEENGYTVFRLNSEDEAVTCTGTFPYMNEGEMLELHGDFIVHSIYGEQLQVAQYEVKEAQDMVSMERYLGSGAIKGVGVALADRIVRKFKGDTFRIIEEEPERLAEVKGVSERKAREIAEQMMGKKNMRQGMMYMQKYGISLKLAAKIYEHYGKTIYSVLEENPYQIADHVPGVGFKTADEIAMKIGIHTSSEFRIRSGIFYALLQCVSDGGVYMEKDTLLWKASELLGVSIEDMESYLSDLSMEKKVILKEYDKVLRVYPAHYYYMELQVARMLVDLHIQYSIPEEEVEQHLKNLKEDTKFALDERQAKAVEDAVKNGVFVLTGGPGTGKTTTINAMIHYFREARLEIRLAAPTGRAAKRMTEATGCEAQTIHRMLEVSGHPDDAEQKSGFGRNEENPLEADVIIVDEMSMVDLSLFHALLKAILPGTRLILVGDGNQLPSVGAGNVLNDIVKPDSFPRVILTKIFRQARESDIVVNAHRIQRGEKWQLTNESQDFFFLKRTEANVIIKVMLTLIQEKLPKYVEATPYDIQILTPMRKGLLGVERLNPILQEHLNPAHKNKKEYEVADRIFREGDKVMQIKNNYQLEWEVTTKYGMAVDTGVGIFNGDMGIVKEIDVYGQNLVLEFDEGRKVKYPFQSLDEIEHAYAITIHKAQGSEYPAVLIPLLPGPKRLYNRNLLYTAITRARRCVAIIGEEATMWDMVNNSDEHKRNTSLEERIEEMQM
jgi:helicase, putative, RecD/TraA family